MMEAKTSQKALSVVIPVYNGEKTIHLLVGELIKNLQSQYNLEIVLVNDKSIDNSDEVCTALYENYKGIVKYYSLSRNVGEHSAIMAGLNKSAGDFIVLMDDDFQNPVSGVIKLMNEAIRGEYDVVYSYYEKKEDSFLRNLGSWFNDKAANIMLKKPKDLYLSSFKVLNRFVVNEIIKYQAPFPYIDGLILQITDNIGKIQVEHYKRQQGRSGYTIRKLISLWLNMFTNFSILPLRFAVILGFTFAMIGLASGVYTVIEKFLDPYLPVGFATLFVSISVFAGIQLIALGMLGEYIGRVFLSINRKPQFTIKKSCD